MEKGNVLKFNFLVFLLNFLLALIFPKISICKDLNWYEKYKEAYSLAQSKQYDLAYPKINEAISGSKNLFFNSENKDYAYCLNELGDIAAHLKKYDESEKAFRKALEIYEGIKGNDPGVGIALSGLATLRFEQKNFKEAIPLYEQAIKISSEINGRNDDGVFDESFSVALCFYELKDYDKSTEAFRGLLEKIRKAHPENIKSIGLISDYLSMSYFFLGDIPESLKAESDAIKFAQKAKNPDNDQIGMHYFKISKIYYGTGNKKEAGIYLDKSLKLIPEESLAILTRISALTLRARIYFENGQRTLAEKYSDEVLNSSAKVFRYYRPEYGSTIEEAIQGLKDIGDSEKAKTLQQQLESVRATSSS